MDFLARVGKPSRYCGNELHSARRDWRQIRRRSVFVFPDLYEIGMSHQGLQILYHEVNRRDDWLAERAYAPDLDLERELRDRGLPLFSLESRRPLAEFDLIGITLPYELCYTNILTVLDLADLPLYARDRRDEQPLVLGGGPCAFHPEPVADFFDAILLGDGEEAIHEIVDRIAEGREQGLARRDLLALLTTVAGVYVPALANAAGVRRVGKRTIADLSRPVPYAEPLVPLTRIVHDRLGIEIARGCTRGCRFCQAGIIYRPVRERHPDEIVELAERGLACTGFDEVALLSLSTGDYSCVGDVLARLMNRVAARRISVSLPSMRVGTLTPAMMEQIRRVRKTGFTLAPEAGSERLRRVINKGITEADLLATCREAVRMGWRRIKLYFMFGLPTETEEDIEAIADLVHKVHALTRCAITVSVATFVPKPHTPFQWERQLSMDEAFERISYLRGRLRGKAFSVRWHDPRQSYLEGVLCRGGRELAAVVESAWRQGARLDAWSDHFRLDTWQQAALDRGIELDRYLAARSYDDLLPWRHLDTGVDEGFYRRERERAAAEAYTPDCRVHGCQQCGLCDFKTLRPVTWEKEKGGGADEIAAAPAPAATAAGHRYHLTFTKLAPANLLSHLEMIGVFYRAFRRIELPLLYSRGHNPAPRVSFAAALPLGVESEAEYLDLELEAPVADMMAMTGALNASLPAGLRVTSWTETAAEDGGGGIARYHVTLPGEKLAAEPLHRFLETAETVALVRRKGVSRSIDIRPLVKAAAAAGDGGVDLDLLCRPSVPGIKAHECIACLYDLSDEDRDRLQVRKTAWRPLAAGE
ncbi:MAG: TIGR03960 family B12-binding radical SAM protein [Thermodesulfobacteriota bacterium]